MDGDNGEHDAELDEEHDAELDEEHGGEHGGELGGEHGGEHGGDHGGDHGGQLEESRGNISSSNAVQCAVRFPVEGKGPTSTGGGGAEEKVRVSHAAPTSGSHATIKGRLQNALELGEVKHDADQQQETRRIVRSTLLSADMHVDAAAEAAGEHGAYDSQDEETQHAEEEEEEHAEEEEEEEEEEKQEDHEDPDDHTGKEQEVRYDVGAHNRAEDLVRSAARRVAAATKLDVFRIRAKTDDAQVREVGRQLDDFHAHIDHLTSDLTIKANVLRLKMKAYANWFDRSQILQFAAASVIALAAAVHALLGEYLGALLGTNVTADLDPVIAFGFNMFILLVSSGAGFMTLIVKFRGWKEKADEMNAVYRRSMDVVKYLPDVQHRLRRCQTAAELRALMEAFDEREFKFFRETVQDINDHLSFDAHTSHLPGFYQINLRHKRDQLEYTKSLNSILLEERALQNVMLNEMAADPRSSVAQQVRDQEHAQGQHRGQHPHRPQSRDGVHSSSTNR